MSNRYGSIVRDTPPPPPSTANLSKVHHFAVHLGGTTPKLLGIGDYKNLGPRVALDYPSAPVWLGPLDAENISREFSLAQLMLLYADLYAQPPDKAMSGLALANAIVTHANTLIPCPPLPESELAKVAESTGLPHPVAHEEGKRTSVPRPPRAPSEPRAPRPPSEPKAPRPPREPGTPSDRPKSGSATGRVWEICDEVKKIHEATNRPIDWKAFRADVMKIGQDEKLNISTIGVQYGKWRNSQ